MTLAAIVIVGMVVAAAGGSCRDDNVLMQMNQDRRGRRGRWTADEHRWTHWQNTGLNRCKKGWPFLQFSAFPRAMIWWEEIGKKHQLFSSWRDAPSEKTQPRHDHGRWFYMAGWLYFCFSSRWDLWSWMIDLNHKLGYATYLWNNRHFRMEQSDKFGVDLLVDTVEPYPFFRFEMLSHGELGPPDDETHAIDKHLGQGPSLAPSWSLHVPWRFQLVDHWLTPGIPWLHGRTAGDNDRDNAGSVRDRAVSVRRSELCQLPHAGDQPRAPRWKHWWEATYTMLYPSGWTLMLWNHRYFNVPMKTRRS